MNRRELIRRSLAAMAVSGAGVSMSAVLSGCGSSGQPSSDNRFVQTNLVANNAVFQPQILDTTMVNAWGIAIRPAGSGGHFWVTASSTSYEYVGDVNGTPLFQDSLKTVTLPMSQEIPVSGDPVGASNGVVFNPGPNFVITQDHPNGPITSFARFIFVSDNGVLSAWTERRLPDGSFDRPPVALTMQDYSAAGSSFFGLAINPTNDKLFAVDFGANPAPDGAANPKIRVFDSAFNEEPLNGRFTNPFSSASGFQVGDLVPFNIQTLTYGSTTSVFIAYVNTSRDENGQLVVAVEDSGRGRGRLVEYTPNGDLVAIWEDRGTLNGPWGMVVAPANFGAMSNQLIVGNFSDGTLVGFDTTTRRATEFMRDAKGNVIKLQGLWALLFGNGASLGDTNALYFASGPADETDALFGSLRVA